MNIAILRICISRLTKPSPSMILSYVSWILFPDIQLSLKDVSGKNNSYKQRGQRQDDYKISTGEWSIHTFQYMKHSNHSWIFYCFFFKFIVNSTKAGFTFYSWFLRLSNQLFYVWQRCVTKSSKESLNCLWDRSVLVLWF